MYNFKAQTFCHPKISGFMVSLFLLRFGLISSEDKVCLDELYHYNPLLFDVACKRVIIGVNGDAFPSSVFKAHPSLKIM